jgi:ankyrin repeat protein
MYNINYQLIKIKMNQKDENELIREAIKGDSGKLKSLLELKEYSKEKLDEAFRACLNNFKRENENHLNCIKSILKYVEDINYIKGNTLLIESCMLNNDIVVELLLNYYKGKINVNFIDNLNENALHKLIVSNIGQDEKYDLFKKLIEENIDINLENIKGYTQLSYALIMGNSKISEELINLGANKNHIVRSTGDSMLHYAVSGKNPACISLLHDLDIKYRNKNDETPIDLAMKMNLIKIVQMLQTYGDNPDINSKVLSMMQPLQEFRNENYDEALMLLTELKKDKNQSDTSLDWNILLTQYNMNEGSIDNFTYKILEFFSKMNTDKSENYILFLNYGLTYFKLGEYKKTINILIENLKKAMNHYEWIMFANVSFIFLQIFLNLRQLKIANKIINTLEDFLNTTAKMTNKEILKDSICDYLNSKEVINKFSPLDESFCVLNLFKSYKCILEDKSEESKKFLKEYKRISTSCKYREAMPIFSTLKNFYHYLKIRIDYHNNSFFKCYKHLNSLYNNTIINSEKRLNTLDSQVFYYNAFGIINMRQKKYKIAEFFFKKCITTIKSNKAEFEGFNKRNNYAFSIRYNLGLIYFYQKSYEKALAMLRKLEKSLNYYPFLHYRLALCNLEIEIADRRANGQNSHNEMIDRLMGYNQQGETERRIILKNHYINNNCSARLTEAIYHFKQTILLLKDNIYYKKETNDVYNFYTQQTEQCYPTEMKSSNQIITSSYLNLIFTNILGQNWSEVLFHCDEFEHTEYYNKEISYAIDNYKIEAYLGLNQPNQVFEILKRNMTNNNFGYPSLDFKGIFYNKVNDILYAEINYKVALYLNIIKMNFINNNILEVEKGITTILSLLNINLNITNNIITHNDLQPYILNLLVYYYMFKENYEQAINVIKKRKIPLLIAQTFFISKPSK